MIKDIIKCFFYGIRSLGDRRNKFQWYCLGVCMIIEFISVVTAKSDQGLPIINIIFFWLTLPTFFIWNGFSYQKTLEEDRKLEEKKKELMFNDHFASMQRNESNTNDIHVFKELLVEDINEYADGTKNTRRIHIKK